MEKYKYDSATIELLEKSDVPFAIFQMINKRLDIIVISKGFLDMFDFEEGKATYDLLEKDLFYDVHHDDVPFIADATQRFLIDDEPFDVIFRAVVRGETRIIHAYGRHIYKENGVRLEMVWYSDHGPYVENEAFEGGSGLAPALSMAIMDRATKKTLGYDYLTGFPSMTNFFELASVGCQAIRESGKEPVILFLDFNGMKSYNQKYGMEEGDLFLLSFAKILTSYFSNQNCSRFSADHFCVFTDSEGVDEKCQQIIEESKSINGGKTMPLRIGVYNYDSEDVAISAACDRAKLACDAHKKIYESHIYYFDKSMIADLEKRQYIVENLDRALEEEWIKVYHQPIFRTANDRICNEEALARWDDPERGIISPEDFVPVLEESNSVYKLDLYMVEKVLEKLKGQMEHGVYVVPESVNFSRADFYTCDLVEEVRSRVDKSGIGRDKLVIEITESAIADDIDFMTERIYQFKKLGFTVWMDDYGSGYSSPIVLQKIPFDLIKIDMLFVSQIGEGDSGKIILTELVKMAMALGIDTIAEGVETEEQMEFLKEIGCTKLQGFYFAKPLSIEEIFEKRDQGAMDMFENPGETDYYVQIGKVNLYDLAFSRTADESLENYFDTWPMLMIECSEDKINFLRCNKSFRDFFGRYFPRLIGTREYTISKFVGLPGAYTLKKIIQCAKDGQNAFVDDRTEEGKTLQLFIRRVSLNPITGAAAVAIAILHIAESPTVSTELTYNYVARALSEDYLHLYFVNLDTEEFTEYSPDGANRDISVERHGTNFFEECRKDAPSQLYPKDIDEFFRMFNKENIVNGLKKNGSVTHTYRIMVDGAPVYVNMKIVAERNNSNNIIIGVNNVDAQMKHKEALEKIREERTAYARITALSGDFMALYMIDPVTEDYSLYSSTAYFNALGSSSEGTNFFEQALIEAKDVIYEDDYEHFCDMLKKDKMLDQIMKNDVFILNYRLIMDEMPVYTQMKAAMVHENDGDKIIIGVLNIDEETRKEHEYQKTLLAAMEEANIDELTGVKNKHAYVDMETQLNKDISEGLSPEFAIAIFDINDLKVINDTKGHQAGDRYIREGCKIICKTFKQSPVFRIGGDEFGVLITGDDYNNLDANMDKIARINQKNKEAGKVVIAAGASKYNGDRNVAAVFSRADKSMYRNKSDLKKQDVE